MPNRTKNTNPFRKCWTCARLTQMPGWCEQCLARLNAATERRNARVREAKAAVRR